jgi:hypothetical protein
MAAATVANVSSRAIVNFCASREVASDRLLAAAGIPRNLIDEPGAKISADQVFALWGEAQQATCQTSAAKTSNCCCRKRRR